MFSLKQINKIGAYQVQLYRRALDGVPQICTQMYVHMYDV